MLFQYIINQCVDVAFLGKRQSGSKLTVTLRCWGEVSSSGIRIKVLDQSPSCIFYLLFFRARIMLYTWLAVVLLYVAAALASDEPIVNTTGGYFRGTFNTSRSGRLYVSFENIPFAAPPIDDLRFKPPKEPSPWSGVRNSTNEGPWCIQYNIFSIKPQVTGTENCLYLSVFTHNVISTRNIEPKPVMVLIHGGGFISGDKSRTSPKFLMDKDVVVVSINYRLGIMGFLSFEDKEQPGNQGLKDQVMALKWVQRNIDKFCGDPNKVTLVGAGAGAISVSHHIISPLSKGLFHRAIAESGSSYNTWSVMPPGLAKTRAQRLAYLVGCRYNKTGTIVTCLQGIYFKNILQTLNQFKGQFDPMTLLFQPVLEPKGPEAFLTGSKSAWNHNRVPLLTGITSGEGSLSNTYFRLYNIDYTLFNNEFKEIAPISLQYSQPASDPDEITKKIKLFYFGDREITIFDYAKIIELYGDSWIAVGVIDAANKHTGDVYFYYFDYIGDYMKKLRLKNKLFISGAGHAEEAHYIFENLPDFNGEDLRMSEKLVTIWTKFATDGNLTSLDDTENHGLLKKFLNYISPGKFPLWNKWTAERSHYLQISKSGFEMKEKLYEDRYRFWCNLNYKDKY